jgi:hypothetical protein
MLSPERLSPSGVEHRDLQEEIQWRYYAPDSSVLGK